MTHEETRASGLRIAYADPPYPGKAELYAEHPDYGGEVDHAELITHLQEYDGWALSTGSWALQDVLALCPAGVRILIWTKHSIARSWEPVIVVPARNEAHIRRLRDWIRVEPEYFQWRPKPESYVIGQKPEPFCRWLFEWLGARPEDTLDDLFPGSGAVGRAWEKWRAQPDLLTAHHDDNPTLSSPKYRTLVPVSEPLASGSVGADSGSTGGGVGLPLADATYFGEGHAFTVSGDPDQLDKMAERISALKREQDILRDTLKMIYAAGSQPGCSAENLSKLAGRALNNESRPIGRPS